MENNEIKNLIIEARGGANPGRLSEILVSLSGWYATLAEELENIEVFWAEAWLEARKGVKSDTMADKTIEASRSGQNRTKLRIQLKYIEKVISSIKVRLRVKEGESFGRF